MKMSDDGYVEIVGFLNEDSKAEKAGLKSATRFARLTARTLRLEHIRSA